MASERLTKVIVDRAIPGERDHFIWDTKLSGFGLKVTPSGGKSYVYQYRTGGREAKTKRVTIGRHGSPWTPDEARKEAERLAIDVAKGGDPQASRKTKRVEAVTLAFDAYAERFITGYLVSHWERRHEEGTRLLRTGVIPFFGSRPLPSITRRDITALFETLAARPGIAKNTSTVLNKLFTWAVGRGDLEFSPMFAMVKPVGPKSRERYLDDAELGALIAASRSIDHPFAGIVRVLLLSGLRRNEVAEMAWSEVDLSANVWTIPSKRTKNKKDHLVPLTPPIVAELLVRRSVPGEYVFAPPDSGPITNWGHWVKKLRDAYDVERRKRGIPVDARWTIHDLRRSVATGLQRLSIAHEVIEAVQGRATGQGSSTRYQRHHFFNEKREALQRWADHLKSLE